MNETGAPFDLAALGARAPRFERASPTPHGIVDDFLDAGWLARHGLAAELRALSADPSLPQYRYFNTRSAATDGATPLSAAARALLAAASSPELAAWLSAWSGIEGLVADPDLANGGFHFIARGGYLRLHRDELIHPFRPNLRRRLNVMLYLAEGWQEAFGGHLELWTPGRGRRIARIAPRFNRLVATAIEDNVHGVPDPVTCPPGCARTALVVWFYSEEASVVPFRPARFYSAPGDSVWTRAGVRAESVLFGAYHRARRLLKLRNESALRWMRALGYDRWTQR